MVKIAKPNFGTKFWVLFLVAWILAASAIAVLLGRLNWVDYYKLARSGVAIEGHITRKEPSNHLAVYYSYTIGSKIYYGVGHAASTEALQSMGIGDTLLVHYLAEDPQVSCWGDPKRLLASETLPVLFAALISPPVLMTLVYRKFRRWSGINHRGSSI